MSPWDHDHGVQPVCLCGNTVNKPVSPYVLTLFGWRRIDGEWTCPACSESHGEHLRRVIARQRKEAGA